MKYNDLVLFEVDPELQKRLGYSKIYVAGKDFSVQQTPKQGGSPVIIRSKDTNSLLRYLKDSSVAGVIFDDNILIKKAIEKVADTRKTIFIPVSYLFWKDIEQRQSEIHKIRKILAAAHSLKAKVMLVTLADRKESLVSTNQLAEISNMLMDTKNSKFTLFGGGLHDN